MKLPKPKSTNINYVDMQLFKSNSTNTNSEQISSTSIK